MKKVFVSLAFFAITLAAFSSERNYAVQGTVTGRVQQVGFRAFLLKLAIRYNLSGFAENLRNGLVIFRFQGDKNRVMNALSQIKNGNPKARVDSVNTQEITPDNTTVFRVKNWTSVSRNFHTPVDLVFRLRTDNSEWSIKKTKKHYKRMIKSAMRSRAGTR